MPLDAPRSLVRLLLATFVVVAISCESDDSTTDPEPPAPISVSGTIGATGGTLTSPNGRLGLTIPPGALTEDTMVSVTEIDPADVDPVFGGYAGRAALRMTPDGLDLALPADVRFDLPLAITELRAERGGIGWQQYPIHVGWAKEMEVVRLPNQHVDYSLAGSRVTLTIKLDYFGDVTIGTLGESELAKLASLLTVDDPPYVQQEPFQVQVDHRFAAKPFSDLGGMTYVDPPQTSFESAIPHEGPITPIQDIVEGFATYEFTNEFTGETPGSSELQFGFRYELSILDLSSFDTPDNVDPVLGTFMHEIWIKPLSLFVDECALPPCDDPPSGISIATGMKNLEGLHVAYETAGDPAPLGGASPWLYVTGADGVQYHRLNVDLDGSISSTTEIGSIPADDLWGVVPVAADANSGRTRAIFYYSFGGGFRTHWNDQGDDFGAVVGVAATPVLDASAYGGSSNARGFVFCNGSSVRFTEHDPGSGFFFEASQTILNTKAFPDATGGPATAFVDPITESVLVVMDGTPGQIWFHDRASNQADGVDLGFAQNGVRQIRGRLDVVAITNETSGTVSVAKWGGNASLSAPQHVTVPQGPVGVDLTSSSSAVYILTTSPTGNVYNIITTDLEGVVQSNDSFPLPGACSGVKHAVFVETTAKTYVAAACATTGSVEIFEVTL